jgi:hypothetical protein
VPDYVRDFRDIVSRGDGSELKRNRLLKKIDKFARIAKEVGARIDSQSEFVKSLCADGHGDYPELMMQLCVARLTRGDFSDWTGWEYRNEWARASYSPQVPNRRWRLEKLKSIAVLGEQGIGDEIMFGSCLPDIQIPKVVYECDPRLVGVFSRSLGIECKPRADIVTRNDETIKYLTAVREEDCFIPVGDLPRLFRKSRQAFPGTPFLKPLPEHVEKWAHLKGRTGIAWRSRTGQFKPADLGVENPVCLQYDHWPHETEGMTLPECDLRNDVEDILGICANLERVVTVPQTIVHFAGSIGTPVDVVIPPKGSSRVNDAFRWRYVDPMPWYRNVRVYESLSAY